MNCCFFVSDLHGEPGRYLALFDAIRSEAPGAVFFGGDLLPPMGDLVSSTSPHHRDFLGVFVRDQLRRLREDLGANYPRIFVILGNDDQRAEEASVLDLATQGYWEYVHDRRIAFGEYTVYGYSFVPPTPFMLKDWERYDVSRHVDPGSVSPEEGRRSVPMAANRTKWATIKEDLEQLTNGDSMDRAILLFHTPPYNCSLDRAALDGQSVDYVPLDVHVGSIAVRRFIESRRPLITLHGHVHESPRITGQWKERLEQTWAYSAAHDGPELALVRFDPSHPELATRELIFV